MNYTQNYHLPQWEKADRVLMDDFNQMCLDLESGMDGLDAKMNNIKGVLQDHDHTLDAGLFRLAYNHYCLYQEADPKPVQLGMFFEDRCKGLAPAGAIIRNQGTFMTLAEGNITQEEFFASITVESELNVVRGNLNSSTPYVANFYSPLPGFFDHFVLQVPFKNAAHESIALRLRLENLDSGVTEWLKILTYTVTPNTTSTSSIVQTINQIPFHGKCRYQLVLEAVAADFDGTGGFRLDSGVNNKAQFYKNYPGCTLSYTMQDFEGSHGGAVIVRGREGGAGGTVSLLWNGQPAPLAAVRKIPVENWEPMDEFIFKMDGPLPDTNELSLSFQCNQEGEFWLFDWGAILF